MNETQRLISLISGRKISQGENDKIFWLVDKKGQYTVKANYRHLEGVLIGIVSACLIWNNCIPPQIEYVHMGGLVGQGLDCRSTKEKGFSACK